MRRRNSRRFTTTCRSRRIWCHRHFDCGYTGRAMSRVSTIKMTARQFLELGEDPPGVRLELVDGEIAVSPSPIPDHSYTCAKLASILDQHIEELGLGQLFLDVDTIFGEHDVRRPDVLFFSSSRLHLIGPKAM